MASLDLRFATSDAGDGTYFRFYDVTKVYNIGYNPGGYGLPNIQISDIDWARLEITRLGDPTVYTIDLFSDMPSSDPNFFVTILNTQLGLTSSQKIVSDIYTLTYTIGSFGGACEEIVLATSTHSVAIMPKLRCCIKTIRQGLPVPTKAEKCCCENKDITGLCNADQILQAICDLVACDQLERAAALIAWLQLYCDCTCKTCS